MTETLSAREAIVQVLTASGKPMKAKEIVEAALPLTSLKGKTPGATIQAGIYTGAKKPDCPWEQVGKGTFAIASKTKVAARQAKPHPKPSQKAKAERVASIAVIPPTLVV